MTEPDPPRPPVVLVVDDEALLRMLATEHFEEAGYEVLEAENGATALDTLRRRPDIRAVFTDVQMPGRPDGLALAREVRDLLPCCAVVVVSGRMIPSRSELGDGIRFVSKPYGGAEIVTMIGNMIGYSGEHPEEGN